MQNDQHYNFELFSTKHGYLLCEHDLMHFRSTNSYSPQKISPLVPPKLANKASEVFSLYAYAFHQTLKSQIQLLPKEGRM